MSIQLHCGRGAYFCSRYDGKARAETNEFDRYFKCRMCCDLCMAERPTARSNPTMWYMDFRADAPHTLTCINDATYKATTLKVSPWTEIEGWKLGTAMHDLMHVVYLGTARDLIPSLLQDWLDHGCLGSCDRPVDERLRSFSLEMIRTFKKNRRPSVHGLYTFQNVL